MPLFPTQTWSTAAFNDGYGPVSSCAVSEGGEYVAVGGMDFSVAVIPAVPGAGVLCRYTTGGSISTGVVATNSTFIVSADDNAVSCW